MSTLMVKSFASLEYLAALELQELLVESKHREFGADIVLFVEHPHVYTLGRSGKKSNILAAREVPVICTSRGGDVTYHGPGQLVVYPIIDLHSKLRKDVHSYVRDLEAAAIRTLKDFDIEAKRRPPYTGIWIDDRKIAAIGVAVRRSITFHGLALNVNTDLSYFERIIPCGLTWAQVTSMRQELAIEANLAQVRERFLFNFSKIFGYHNVVEWTDPSGDLNVLNGLNDLNP